VRSATSSYRRGIFLSCVLRVLIRRTGCGKHIVLTAGDVIWKGRARRTRARRRANQEIRQFYGMYEDRPVAGGAYVQPCRRKGRRPPKRPSPTGKTSNSSCSDDDGMVKAFLRGERRLTSTPFADLFLMKL